MLVAYEPLKLYSQVHYFEGFLSDGRKYNIRLGIDEKDIAVRFLLCPSSTTHMEIPVKNIQWCNLEITASKLNRLIEYLDIRVVEGVDRNSFLISFPSSRIRPELKMVGSCAFANCNEFDDALVSRIEYECRNILSLLPASYNTVVMKERFLRKALQIPQLMRFCKITVVSEKTLPKVQQQVFGIAEFNKGLMEECKKQLFYPSEKSNPERRRSLRINYFRNAKIKDLAERAYPKLRDFFFSDDPIKASMRRAIFLDTNDKGETFFKPPEAFDYLYGLKIVEEDCLRVKKKLFATEYSSSFSRIPSESINLNLLALTNTNNT